MLAGAAPTPALSGQTIRHRLNRRGDRHLDSALHIAAIQHQRHDPRTVAYFNKRRAEDKTDRGDPTMPQALHRQTSTTRSRRESTTDKSVLARSRAFRKPGAVQ